MTQVKHMKKPWKVFYAKNNGLSILGVGDSECEGVIASNGAFWGDDDEAREKAEHVVKCVNCHDELLETLESQKEWLSNIEILEFSMNGFSDAYKEISKQRDLIEKVIKKAKDEA